MEKEEFNRQIEKVNVNQIVAEHENDLSNPNLKTCHHRTWSATRAEERQSPTISRRSQSLKRRDSSWDKKWEAQSRTEGTRQSRTVAKPGKLNNFYWEKRVKDESSLPPKTPPPKRKLREMLDGRITPISR